MQMRICMHLLEIICADMGDITRGRRRVPRLEILGDAPQKSRLLKRFF